MNTLLSFLSVALYAGAWITLARSYRHDIDAMYRGGTPKQALACALVLSALGLMCHGSVLARSINTVSGLDVGFFNSASATTWVITSLLTILAISRPVAALGLIIWPLAAVAIIASTAFPMERLLSPGANAGVHVHVFTSVLAASVLTIAACQSLVLYVQEGRLRARRPGRMTRVLPPLQLQEMMLVQLLVGGFFLLSLSLASGIVFVQDLLAQHLVHKTVLAFTAWLVFATVLYGRWRFGWRGRTLIRWSLGGFAALWLAYFGAKLVLEILLGRAWSA